MPKKKSSIISSASNAVMEKLHFALQKLNSVLEEMIVHKKSGQKTTKRPKRSTAKKVIKRTTNNLNKKLNNKLRSKKANNKSTKSKTRMTSM